MRSTYATAVVIATVLAGTSSTLAHSVPGSIAVDARDPVDALCPSPEIGGIRTTTLDEVPSHLLVGATRILSDRAMAYCWNSAGGLISQYGQPEHVPFLIAFIETMYSGEMSSEEFEAMRMAHKWIGILGLRLGRSEAGIQAFNYLAARINPDDATARLIKWTWGPFQSKEAVHRSFAKSTLIGVWHWSARPKRRGSLQRPSTTSGSRQRSGEQYLVTSRRRH